MATHLIEECFPRTATYINDVFEHDSRERGGHHNYVIEQKCCNFSQRYGTTIADSDAETIEQADNDFLQYLKSIDLVI